MRKFPGTRGYCARPDSLDERGDLIAIKLPDTKNSDKSDMKH